MLRSAKILVGCLLLGGAAYASPPNWWSNPSTKVIDPNGPHTTASNYSPANQGQAMNMAKQAAKHLDAYLPGGAGAPIHALVDSFSATNPQTRYSPLNAGQLKRIAKPFFDRLLATGFNTKAHLIAHGAPANWAFNYPWNPSTPVAENYRPVLIGALKFAFCFDLDTDQDGLFDVWETQTFGNLAQNTSPDSDGDTISDYAEYLAGTNANDFWNGSAPVLTIVSGNQQGHLPGQTLSQPLVVRVSNAQGTPINAGSVTFSITSLSGGSLSPAGATSINNQGLAQTSLTLPSGAAAIGATIAVKAQITNTVGTAQVTFTATVGDPGLDPEAPGRPEIISEHGSTEALIQWEDRSNNETAFYIERTADCENWVQIATLPANTTSFTDTGLAPEGVYYYRVSSHNNASP